VISFGESPFLEASTKGDKRFSAFHAQVNGRSIETIYQGAKRFGDHTGLHWREAKGKRADNEDEVRLLYSKLWETYIEEHPELVPILLSFSGVSDVFGQVGHASQAEELYRIMRMLKART